MGKLTKETLLYFARFWKWFVLGFAVSITMAFLYLWSSTPVYRVSSSIILKDARVDARANTDMLSFALSGASNNVANELCVLRSYSLVRKVVDRLDLHTVYTLPGKEKGTTLYKKSPVTVNMAQGNLDTLSRSIRLLVEMNAAKAVKIHAEIGEVRMDTLFETLPALLPTPSGNISFTERLGVAPMEKPFRVSIHHPGAVARKYRARLRVEPPSRMALILELSINTPYPAIGKDFLNTLVDVYNSETIQDKKDESLNIQTFINDRLQIINGELTEVEQDVETYKLNWGLTDIDSDLQRDLQMRDRYEKQLVELETEMEIVNSLNAYINDPDNMAKTIPFSQGLADQMLIATASEYNRLLLEREHLAKSMTGDNPAMHRLDEQIAGLRQNIGVSVNSVLNGLAIRRRDVLNQARIYGGRIGNIPARERGFMEVSRAQQVKSKLFLKLLQQREENSLSLAATSNSAKVLDEATVEGIVSPQSLIILGISFLLGLLVPAGGIYLVDSLMCKITCRSDIDRISKVPVMAEIPRFEGKGEIAVRENANDEINEAFRVARTDLLLMLGAGNKVVSFTSTVQGEGKTFVAVNMATSIALLGKRVLIAGMDLRVPRLLEIMNLHVRDGLSLFLSGFEKDIKKLIVPSGIHPNLDVLPAGQTLPNPAELLSRPSLEDAISKLSGEYDYILIDSAPCGQVADAFVVDRVANMTVYICRAGYSGKNNLRYMNELVESGKLTNLLLVVNDLTKYQRPYGYGYGYGNKEGNKKAKKGHARKVKR